MRTAAASLLLGLALVLASSAAGADDRIYTGFMSDVALGGHDPVAYHTEGRPVEGSSEHEVEWRGATWRFASAENRAKFEADPQRYAPAYGGYCAYAVAQGTTAPGDPEVWKIVDGTLYLNVNEAIADRWEKDIPGYIAKADANWPDVVE